MIPLILCSHLLYYLSCTYHELIKPIVCATRYVLEVMPQSLPNRLRTLIILGNTWYIKRHRKGRFKDPLQPHSRYIRVYWCFKNTLDIKTKSRQRRPKPRAQLKPIHFDTHSFPIRINSHSSYCSTPCKDDYVGELQPIKAQVRGLGPTSMQVTHKGTVRWIWEDDQGQQTEHLIPGTLYMPQNSERILASHHWAQVTSHGANMTVDSNSTILKWGSHTRTVPI